MRIVTNQFGEMEVKEEDVVRFPQGLPGFEQLKAFVFVTPDPELPFSYMQSVENGDIAFLVADPFLFYPDYEFEISPQIEEELKIEEERDVAVWGIITAGKRADEMTVNLLAPVVVNVKKKLARQVILHDTHYRTKHPLFPNETPDARSGNRGDRHVSIDT